MDETNEALFQRIRAKCQRLRWYGPDMDDPFEKQRRAQEADANSHVAYYWYAQDGQQYKIEKDTDLGQLPLMNGFAYPLASETAVAATEQELGFILPPLLRQLYTHVANGGFGPGFGLMGVVNGYGEAGNMLDSYQFHQKRARLIDLEEYAWRGDILDLPDTVWPRTMLYLCDWGWGASFCIDCQTEKVYLKFPGERDLHYRLKLQARSLAEWFEQWLRGELKYSPPQQEIPELVIDDLQLFFESGPVSNDGNNSEIDR